jgi:hypothetical protein
MWLRRFIWSNRKWCRVTLVMLRRRPPDRPNLPQWYILLRLHPAPGIRAARPFPLLAIKHNAGNGKWLNGIWKIVGIPITENGSKFRWKNGIGWKCPAIMGRPQQECRATSISGPRLNMYFLLHLQWQ